jgi:hypothetical protein
MRNLASGADTRYIAGLELCALTWRSCAALAFDPGHLAAGAEEKNTFIHPTVLLNYRSRLERAGQGAVASVTEDFREHL